MRISSPARVTSSASSVLTGERRLALGRPEGGEIVPADQALRRCVHRRGIERRLDQPGTAGLDGERRAPVDDAIEIRSRPRAEKPRMEVAGRLHGIQHRDRRRGADGR